MIDELLGIIGDLRGQVGALRQEVEDMRAAPTFPRITVAAAAPTMADDIDAGYAIHSLWRDTAGGDTYICTDATAGAAVWVIFA